jgi:ABC-type nitrate/sulfonate/bicarbonate transport system permease component
MNQSLSRKWYFILPVLSILTIILAFMFLASREGTLIPSPMQIWQRFIELMTTPISKAILPIHIWVSLRRVLAAFIVSIALGVSLGVFLGWNRMFNALLSPVFEILRPIPPIAWIPLVILWFGIGELSKIFIVFIGSFVPIVINTHAGMNAIDPLLINCGKSLGANRRELLVNVAFPATIPAILAGVKTALSSGWMCVLAAEMIAAKQGVGYLIVVGQETGDMSLIMVGMIAIGAVNAVMSIILTKLEGVLCPWQFKKAK